ncbi:MAG: virulence protein SciE type [Bryobacteraceae bacterium]|nr:virulence protein SciE type [Bryobacteraceae bacterium]
MGSKELLRDGKLNEAIRAVGEEIRSHPEDSQRRTFLFELLCFAGEYDRALKHLEALLTDSPDRRLGAMRYVGAINAERTRQSVIQEKRPPAEGPPVSGTLNGVPFQSLEDADPRIGRRLEVIAGHEYLWVPLEHISSIEMEPPRRLRDLLWAPAVVQTGPSFGDRDLGEVLLPALSPFSWRHSDDAVRLGRVTVWEEDGDGHEVPYGQKMLLTDEELIPLLEVRRLEIRTLGETP